MKTVATIVAVASAASAVYAQSGPIIQSPASLVVCQPALLSFSGGTAPYYISVLPGGQSTAAALEQFPTQTGNSYTWNVNIAAGQSITLSIRDSTGAVNYSSELPIQSGSDTSCVGQSLTNSGSSTPGGAATTGASNSSGSSSAARTTSSSAASSSSMQTSSRATSSSNAASSAANTASSATSAAASAASSAAPTGAASTKYVANAAGVLGVAAIVAAFA